MQIRLTVIILIVMILLTIAVIIAPFVISEIDLQNLSN